MNTRSWTGALGLLAAFVLGLLLVPNLAGAAAQAEPPQIPDSLTYTLTVPPYKLTATSSGDTDIEIEGFMLGGQPGDPQLPVRSYYLALPPAADLDSLRLEIGAVQQTELPDTYRVAPVTPSAHVVDEQEMGDWGSNAAAISSGRNTRVYGHKVYFPAEPVKLVGTSQMRKWRFVELQVWPASYDPVGGRLRVTTQVTVTLSYNRLAVEQELTEYRDNLMDDRAAELFLNFDEARVWYELALAGQPTAVGPGYVIITTNKIEECSQKTLNVFKAHKEALGYTVTIVTEDDYDALSGELPDQRPQKVRQWLKDHVSPDRIQYVLLIGNPDPTLKNNAVKGFEADDLPMLVAYPDGGEQKYPTDTYFADLTGAWDSNNNGKFGEPRDKVDFAAEVWVGRVPLRMPYALAGDNDQELICNPAPGWAVTLDSILEKTIVYETTAGREWRRSAFLPMTFQTPLLDQAELAEHMKSDYLQPERFKTYTMYVHNAPFCNSKYPSDGELVRWDDTLSGADKNLASVEEDVANYWAHNPTGVVVLAAHGGGRNASIGWNGCGYIYEDLGDMFTVAMFKRANDPVVLDDYKPALAFLGDCSNSRPDWEDDLASQLLANGAVGVVSATSLAHPPPPSQGKRTPTEGDASLFGLAYYYVKYLVDNDSIGEALFMAKGTPTGYENNAMSFNLLGDPSIHLSLPGPLTRVSSGPKGIQADGWSARPSLSADGRFVAYQSAATNLLDADGNGKIDIFIHDRQTGETTLASPGINGAANRDSTNPVISADGRFVAFQSQATNLVTGDSNQVADIFVYDREEQRMERVSLAGQPGAVQGNGGSYDPAMSADGRYIAFQSDASNLIGNDGNNAADIFVRDRSVEATTIVSVNSGASPEQGNGPSYTPSISADGRYVVYASRASNLVEGDTQICIDEGGDLHNCQDIFVYDRIALTTSRIGEPQRETGSADHPAISADSSYVAYESWDHYKDEPPLSRIVVTRRDTNESTTITPSWPEIHQDPAISADGAFVAYATFSPTEIPYPYVGTNVVHLQERETGQTIRVAGGDLDREGSRHPALSADGRYVAFDSDVNYLFDYDTNEARDVFAYYNDPCAPIEGNIISNFCFDEGRAPWKYWHNNRQGYYGVFTSSPFAGGHAATIAVGVPGNNVQFYQPGLSLQPKTTYQLSFAAYSNDGRDMRVYVHRHNHDGTYTNYGLRGERVNLEPYWKVFTMTFTTPNLADTSDGRLRFWLAPFAQAGSVYHIDHVVLRPLGSLGS